MVDLIPVFWPLKTLCQLLCCNCITTICCVVHKLKQTLYLDDRNNWDRLPRYLSEGKINTERTLSTLLSRAWVHLYQSNLSLDTRRISLPIEQEYHIPPLLFTLRKLTFLSIPRCTLCPHLRSRKGGWLLNPLFLHMLRLEVVVSKKSHPSDQHSLHVRPLKLVPQGVVNFLNKRICQWKIHPKSFQREEER